MKLFQTQRLPDRARVQSALQTLKTDLSRSLEDDLISLILYGDFIKEMGFRVATGPVNVMLVLRHISCQRLDKISPVIRKAEKAFPLAIMTLTEEDIKTSCDVFPVKFHDMQRFHRLLAGRDVLSDLAISDDNLRLRCEQQLKNLMIRLRAAYLRRNKGEQELSGILSEAANHFLRDTAACLFLKTGVAPEDESDLSEDFGQHFKIDVSVMQDLLQLRDRQTPPRSQELTDLFDRFMKLVHDAAIAVDALEAN
ncbi:MAG: hypothetical protein CMM07_13510 [Rhodopirellula sp.]|nr:hypothetical protein [Rhodopirellula sp.]